MKKNPLKEMSPAELTKRIAELREELRAHRFGAAGAREKSPAHTLALKKDIARALTLLTEKARA